MKKTLVHVNQHNIKWNSKLAKDPDAQKCLGDKPVLTVKDYTQNRKGNKAEVLDATGNVVGTFVYSPEKPLSCGAKVWFETTNEVRVTTTR